VQHPLLSAIDSNRQLSARTKTLYRECVESFLAYAIPKAGTDPSKYTLSIVESWFDELERGGRQPQTVSVYRKAIRHASRRYSQLERRPDLDFAAAATCNKARPGAPREPLSFDEAARLLATCSSDSLVDIRDRALITLALRTGLRRGGLVALDIEGIHPPKITTLKKGGDLITFEADQETFTALDAWLDVLKRSGATTGPVFREVQGNRIGDRISPFRVWYVFRRRAQQAGIRHVFPHLARHSLVTWLREAGLSPAEVSKLTGQTERTIEDIYTHVRTRGSVSAVLPSLGKAKS
jgi:site-specific recombinase XerC